MNALPVDVTYVRPLGGTLVEMRFDDSALRIIDLRPLMHGPLFDDIFHKDRFNEVKVDPDEGTIVWPNGASLDPFVLRHSKMLQFEFPAIDSDRAKLSKALRSMRVDSSKFAQSGSSVARRYAKSGSHKKRSRVVKKSEGNLYSVDFYNGQYSSDLINSKTGLRAL